MSVAIAELVVGAIIERAKLATLVGSQISGGVLGGVGCP